jgi:integrase
MKAAGIYPLSAGGFRAVACIGRGKGKRKEKRFPAGTAIRTMTRWQEDAARELRDKPTATKGTLAADVDTYLDARRTMPTAKSREQHLRLWIAALGSHRARHTVTAIEIATHLDRWRASGLQPGTVNRRRTALQSFYTVLNGKGGPNPVRGVPKQRETVHPPKRLDYALLQRILDAMPDSGQRHAGDSPTSVSQTKARLRVIAFTGLPHAQIMNLRPEHLHAKEKLLYVKGRRKGRGTEDIWLPLSDLGLAAVSEMFACGAIDRFSQSAMRISFQRAARKVGRPDLTPYDLRHLFGATILRLTQNRAATRDLMLHESDRTTARYTAGEIRGELRAALARFDADVVGSGCGPTGQPGADDDVDAGLYGLS